MKTNKEKWHPSDPLRPKPKRISFMIRIDEDMYEELKILSKKSSLKYRRNISANQLAVFAMKIGIQHYRK